MQLRIIGGCKFLVSAHLCDAAGEAFCCVYTFSDGRCPAHKEHITSNMAAVEMEQLRMEAEQLKNRIRVSSNLNKLILRT